MSATRNIVIAIAALLVPLGAELVSPETGLGFDILLYWPFDFAYVLLVLAAFLLSNQLSQVAGGKFKALVVGLSYFLGWFAISFLAVSQLHLSLGYKL
jgi:hypothetical protein